MIVRLVVVLALLAVAATARALLARRDRGPEPAAAPDARFPGWVTDGADRTWVVFTTPFCASCGPVVEHLEGVDPSARVVTVDASHHTDLARDFAVRRAPTVFEADGQGLPIRRFRDAAAVRQAVPA